MSVLEWCVIGWLLNLVCIFPVALGKELERKPYYSDAKIAALICMLCPFGMLAACGLVGMLAMFADYPIIETDDNEN